MNEFLLYVALPTLVAIAGVSAFYAIKEGNKGHALAEDTRTQQHPAIVPIRDAEFYRVNGHWIFGVRSDAVVQEHTLPVAWLGGKYPQCHEHHSYDCGV